jgi:alpha-L-fucosidase
MSKNKISSHLKYLTFGLLSILLLSSLQMKAQQTGTENPRLHWFREARIGIFIHWGIYAVNGIDESWSFYNGHITYEDYMKQLKGFTASKWQPSEWAAVIAGSGARYAVLTAKHPDGVALWPSKCDRAITVVNNAPAGRDLIAPYMQALRDKGIKAGLYYSLIDWSYPDYPGFLRDQPRYTNDSLRFNRFTEYNLCQINELSKTYKPDLFWFDGDWEQNAATWKAAQIKQGLLNDNPNVIVNSRLAGYGDYGTPENGPPVFRPNDPVWELCLTTNTSWGYQPNDTNYKTPGQVLGILVDCIAMGGNLLLDIGPREDGTIPDEQRAILKELGRWTSKHAEAVYGTLPGIPMECFLSLIHI